MSACTAHYFVIAPAANGVPSPGVCRHCGATRAFANGEEDGRTLSATLSSPLQREHAIAASAAAASKKRNQQGLRAPSRAPEQLMRRRGSDA